MMVEPRVSVYGFESDHRDWLGRLLALILLVEIMSTALEQVVISINLECV
jgi:diacylglycerol kinase